MIKLTVRRRSPHNTANRESDLHDFFKYQKKKKNNNSKQTNKSNENGKSLVGYSHDEHTRYLHRDETRVEPQRRHAQHTVGARKLSVVAANPKPCADRRRVF